MITLHRQVDNLTRHQEGTVEEASRCPQVAWPRWPSQSELELECLGIDPRHISANRGLAATTSIMDEPKVRQPPLFFWGCAAYILLSVGKSSLLVLLLRRLSCFASRGLFGTNTCWGPPRHIMQCRLEDKQRQIRLWLSTGEISDPAKTKGSQKSLWGGAPQSEIGWLWGRAGADNEEAPPACCCTPHQPRNGHTLHLRLLSFIFIFGPNSPHVAHLRPHPME